MLMLKHAIKRSGTVLQDFIVVMNFQLPFGAVYPARVVGRLQLDHAGVLRHSLYVDVVRHSLYALGVVRHSLYKRC